MESLKTSVFSHKPSLKPQGRSLRPTYSTKYLGRSKGTLYTQTQQGPVPTLTVGSPGEASYRQPSPPHAPQTILAQASRGQSWSAEVRWRQHVLFPGGPLPGDAELMR